jgi:hypothetical protein
MVATHSGHGEFDAAGKLSEKAGCSQTAPGWKRPSGMAWQPRDDVHLWLTFNLRAHHMQAQTVARRVEEIGVRV